jgi:hypothetical protein
VAPLQEEYGFQETVLYQGGFGANRQEFGCGNGGQKGSGKGAPFLFRRLAG